MTVQRKVLLEELRGVTSHPTADELYAIVRKRLPHISLGTVYRNLEDLSVHGLVRKVTMAGDQKRFDGNLSPHDHVRCVRCGRVGDVFPVVGAGTDCDPKAVRTDFQISSVYREYEGVCTNCR